MEKEQTTIHRRQRRKPRFLWTVDLNLRSLRYLLFKIFRRRFCYRENTVSRRFVPARRSMRRLGVSWAASLPLSQSISQKATKETKAVVDLKKPSLSSFSSVEFLVRIDVE